MDSAVQSFEEKNWHAMTVEAVCSSLTTDPSSGLNDEEVQERINKYGRNELPKPPKPSALRRLIAQLADPLVGALLVAAVIAGVMAMTHEKEGSFLIRFSDTIAILLIVVLNAILGFIQEGKAEAALEALEKMTTPTARVFRNGLVQEVSSRELVPGDIVEVEAGDSIPADVRIVEESELRTQESALTGESTSVSKDAPAVLPDNALIPERINMAYMGTSAVRGRARAVVVGTGLHSQIGKIGTLVASVERKEAPLQERLARFTHIILWICLAISALLFGLGIWQGNQSWPVLLLTAVSLAVAAIPEGLPAITTITLALGMQRMARRGAIVRRLPAVETLGSATVICSDKTGTLTQNEMTVQALWTDEATYSVTGQGYSSEGTIEGGEKGEALQRLLQTSTQCNQASLEDGQVLGDPTEAALLVLAEKGGIDRKELAANWQRINERPFDSDRQRMAVVVKNKDGQSWSHVKGAPEAILPSCKSLLGKDGPRDLSEEDKKKMLSWCEEKASEGLRVLALADKETPGDEFEEGLVLTGCVAMLDPPRPEVIEAVGTCRKAGIKVVMITGDHKLTAVSIAKKIGMWDEGALAFNGHELDELSEEELTECISRVAVFARVSPEQKLRVVQCHMKRGDIVAMTGDGINDAPGLRTCHIGVAMGQSGTDVAREASDMVLMDDNFATIVHAIYEGRTIFANIRKFIYFLLSVNAGLVAAVLISSFFDWIPMLTPLQLLWINLVTNGMPALALGVEPPAPGVMEEKPRDPDEPILISRDYMNIAVIGSVMAAAALGIFWLPPHYFGAAPLYEARGMAFTFLAFTALLHAFNCRSSFKSVVTEIFSNGFLWLAVALSAIIHLITILAKTFHPVFKTHSLTALQWVTVLLLAALPLPVAELLKVFYRRQPETS